MTIITSCISRLDMKAENFENVRIKNQQDVTTENGEEMITFLSPMIVLMASALKNKIK